MSDIVDRLKELHAEMRVSIGDVAQDAAGEIEDLRILVGNMNKSWNGALLEIGRLHEALRLARGDMLVLVSEIDNELKATTLALSSKEPQSNSGG